MFFWNTLFSNFLNQGKWSKKNRGVSIAHVYSSYLGAFSVDFFSTLVSPSALHTYSTASTSHCTYAYHPLETSILMSSSPFTPNQGQLLRSNLQFIFHVGTITYLQSICVQINRSFSSTSILRSFSHNDTHPNGTPSGIWNNWTPSDVRGGGGHEAPGNT